MTPVQKLSSDLKTYFNKYFQNVKLSVYIRQMVVFSFFGFIYLSSDVLRKQLLVVDKFYGPFNMNSIK